MSPSTWLCVALLSLPPASPAALKDYEAAKGGAGRDPKAHVGLALWCEAHGLDAEKSRHLALAVLYDAGNTTARGLLGLVEHRGRWETPDEVGERTARDESLSARLAEYNRRRADLDLRPGRPGHRRGSSPSGAARAHVALGMWCEQAGLKAEASAHFTSAVVLDPYHDATWKHLGYVRHAGRWMSREQVAAALMEAEAQRRGDRYWEPLLKTWRGWLSGRDGARREEARDLLAGVTDPLAVPSVVRVFFQTRPSDQQVAVQLLGQIDSREASRRLAELAVLSASASLRAAATEALRRREPRDFAGEMVEMIRSPMRYQARPVRGPGSPGGLIVETPRFQMVRTYDAPDAVRLGGNRTGYIGYDVNGLPVAASHAEVSRIDREKPAQAAADLQRIEARTMEMIAEANLKAATSQQRLAADVQAIEEANAETTALNSLVAPVLTQVLGAPAELKDDEDAWHAWWYDKIGYKYDPPPQVQVAVNASPQPPPPLIVSCFVAGTPVRTLHGRRPIESLAVGDQVLTQDTTTGGLSFRPVMVVHHNAPGATFRVELDDGDAVTASIYHRFWLAGRGWAMARELKPGDVLRTLAGRTKVRSVTSGPVVPVFNLDVAGTHTFFVGERDALVHDNTLPDPRGKPFDAQPTLAASASSDD